MNDNHIRRAYDPDEDLGLSDDYDPADFDDFDDLPDDEPEDDEDPEQDPEGAW